MKNNIGYYFLRIVVCTFFIFITTNLHAQDVESAPAAETESSKTFDENKKADEEIIYADSSNGSLQNEFMIHIDKELHNTKYASFSEVPNGVDPGTDPDAPLDDMVWIFVATGFLYGLRRMYRLNLSGL